MTELSLQALCDEALRCAQKGAFTDAERLLRQAVARAPAAPGPALYYGRVLRALGRLSEAAAAFERAAKPVGPVQGAALAD
ncbi:MAG: tetratricopeptide repeat protein [Marivibrio sp.]|uniref:tetratricopeptide repeat protein n=1 Tax=Marivibrio sp. TaxID=2039719 RepID=UPI0032EF7399